MRRRFGSFDRSVCGNTVETVTEHGDERDPERENGDELEELDPRLKMIEDRLRKMEWPKPPPGMKERCLEDFMKRVEDMETDRGNG